MEEFRQIEAAIEKGDEADDEVSERSTLKDSRASPHHDDSIIDIDENEAWITGALDQELLRTGSVELEDEEGSLVGEEDLEEYERARKEVDRKLSNQESDDFTAESLEDNSDNMNRNESVEEEVPTPLTPRPSEPDSQEKEREQIEFWHLATALATMLEVKIPEDNDPEIEADTEEEREQKRRKLVLDGIVKSMRDLLRKE